MSKYSEIKEVKSLKWLANQFPLIEYPESEIDLLLSCVHLYCIAGANKFLSSTSKKVGGPLFWNKERRKFAENAGATIVERADSRFIYFVQLTIHLQGAIALCR